MNESYRKLMPHWIPTYSISLPVRESASISVPHRPPTLVELYTVVGAQSIPEELLMTVLLEVEAILNSKLLGYVLSDVADADLVTPNSLLVGKPDGLLPQVI